VTPEQERAIRARHFEAFPMAYEESECDRCADFWPCDAAVLLAALDAARADADALAAALLSMAEAFHRAHDQCDCPSYRECHVNVCGHNARTLWKYPL